MATLNYLDLCLDHITEEDETLLLTLPLKMNAGSPEPVVRAYPYGNYLGVTVEQGN